MSIEPTQIPPSLAMHFRIVGGVTERIEQVVTAFDVAALATFTEGTANSIIEYMALAKPVVATDGGGTCDVVQEGVTGFLVPPRDAPVFADRVPIACRSGANFRRRRVTCATSSS